MTTTDKPARTPRPLTERQRRARRIDRVLGWSVHLGALLPLALLYYQWYSYLLVDEIREMTLFTGRGGLILLVLSLAMTPLNTLSGWNPLLKLRRNLGLYAFLYVSLHLLLFAVVDYGLNPALLRDALVEKRYALAGLASFVILAALAATSSQFAMRRLKQRWKQLHRWVYAAVVLALIHYFWLVKQGAYNDPILFTLIVALLFALRLPAVRRRVIAARKRIERNWKQRPAAYNAACVDGWRACAGQLQSARQPGKSID